MLFVSWNVNGLRACLKKGFEDFFKDVDADIFAIQETKLQRNQIDLELKDILLIIMMQSRRGIVALLFIQRKNQ
jgi:exonuclease III